MNRWIQHTAAVAALCLLTSAATRAATITVFAAVSLSDAMKEIAAGYEKRTSDKVLFNFGASSFLARQILEGAPADIFFSADEAKMDGLEKAGLISKGSRRSLLSNSLVIVVANEKGADIRAVRDLASEKVTRLALAETKTVPAGIYAKAYLQKQNLWRAVEKKVVPTENVRAALAAVEAGNAEAGIVYKTDASISKKVKIAFEVPANESPRISYPVALVKDAPSSEPAKRFIEELGSARAKQIFEKHGFVVLQ